MNIPTSIVSTQFGQMIVLDTDQNQADSLRGVREPNRDNLAIRRLRAKIEQIKNPVFLDIGGCMGVYTMALSPTVEERGGKVYCFEAQRILANCIAGSIALNGFEQVRCLNKAVGNPTSHNSKIDLPTFDYKTSMNFGSVEFGEEQKETLSQERDYQSKPEKVDLISLDSYIDEFGKVDVIKMDIEGMEEQALQGATQIINTFHPLVYVEWIKSDKQKLQDFFKEMGYARYDCPSRDRGNLWCEMA